MSEGLLQELFQRLLKAKEQLKKGEKVSIQRLRRKRGSGQVNKQEP